MPHVNELIVQLNHEFPQCRWYYDRNEKTDDPAIQCSKHERYLSQKFFRTAENLDQAIGDEISLYHPEDKFQIGVS
jgi:hypothetical protein